jgi:cholesterol oxidase
MAVTAPDDERDFTKSVAITSSIYPDPDTHIEPVTYGRGADSQSFLFTLLTERGGPRTRPFHFLAGVLRHPWQASRALWPSKWSRRSVILLVMQTVDNAIKLKPRRVRWPGGAVGLTTEQDPQKPIPHTLPIAYQAAKWVAQRLGGTPQAMSAEAIFAIPTTAHILGGAPIGADPDGGVVDARHRVFGYENLLVCDGAAVPANVGANPSLTITALAERAMSHVPASDGRAAAEPLGAPPDSAPAR